MRPSMLETGLEVVAYNLNRKNLDLKLFEYGKTYRSSGSGEYSETDHLCLYLTGKTGQENWKTKATAIDIHHAKGIVESLLSLMGRSQFDWVTSDSNKLQQTLVLCEGKQKIAELGTVHAAELKRFDIKQPVFYVDLLWEPLLELARKNQIRFKELPRQLPVYRDLAIIVDSRLTWNTVENSVKKLKLEKLQDVKLFDIFESEKLGKDKKSLAISFTFLDAEKTLTDKEIDGMMSKLMQSLEKEVQAEIRK